MADKTITLIEPAGDRDDKKRENEREYFQAVLVAVKCPGNIRIFLTPKYHLKLV